MSARPPVVERPWRDKHLYTLMVNIGAFLPMGHETRQQVIELGYRIEDLEQEVADLNAELDTSLEMELRDAGQALRDCGYSWDSSTAVADAADAWDDLTR